MISILTINEKLVEETGIRNLESKGKILQLTENRAEDLLSNDSVIELFDTNVSTLSHQRIRKDSPLTEGKHWKILKGSIHWTKLGIFRLTFLLRKTPVITRFHDHIEDLFFQGNNQFFSKLVGTILDIKRETNENSSEEPELGEGSIEKKCTRCKRVLTNDKSKDRGMGHDCWKKTGDTGTNSQSSVSTLPSPGFPDIIPIEVLADPIVESSDSGSVEKKKVDFSPKLQLIQYYYCFTQACTNFHGKSPFRTRKKGRCSTCATEYKPKSR